MKLKKFNQLFENNDENLDEFEYEIQGDDEDYDIDEIDDEDEIQEEDEDIDDTDDMEHLKSLLRSFFRNSNLEASIEHKKLDLMIYVYLENKEKIKTVLRAFEVAKKLKKDILAHYESEFELWETKSGEPLLIFNFFYDDKYEYYNGRAPF
jgi:TATA-binding protein-associated factor Taf7